MDKKTDAEARKEIFEKLSRMLPEDLDKRRDEKLLERKHILKEYYTAKEELLKLAFAKEKVLVEKGMLESHITRELKRDQQLHDLKIKIGNLAYRRDENDIECDILRSFFWRNKV